MSSLDNMPTSEQGIDKGNEITLTKISDSQSLLSIRTTWEFTSYLIRMPGSKIQASEFFKDP